MTAELLFFIGILESTECLNYYMIIFFIILTFLCFYCVFSAFKLFVLVIALGVKATAKCKSPLTALLYLSCTHLSSGGCSRVSSRKVTLPNSSSEVVSSSYMVIFSCDYPAVPVAGIVKVKCSFH